MTQIFPKRSRDSGSSGWRIFVFLVLGVSLIAATLPFIIPDAQRSHMRTQNQEYAIPGCGACTRFEAWGRQAERGLKRAEERAISLLKRKSGVQDATQRFQDAIIGARDDIAGLAAFSRALTNAAITCRAQKICAPISAASCPAGLGPLTKEAGELAQILETVRARSAHCTTMGCPEIECDGWSQSLGAVSAAERALAAMAAGGLDTGTKGLAETFLGRDAKALAADVYHLPVGFPALLTGEAHWGGTGASRAVGEFAAEVDVLARRAGALEYRIGEAVHGRYAPSSEGVAGLWRVSSLRLRLERLVGVLHSLAQAEREEGRGSSVLAQYWAEASIALSEVLLEAMRVEAGLRRPEGEGYESRAAECRTARQLDARRLAGEVAVVKAAMMTCAKRGQCSASNHTPESLEARLDPASEHQARLDAALKMLKEAPELIAVRSAPEVTVAPDLSAYRAGEAMRVRVSGSGNACLREGGGLLAVVGGGAKGAAERTYSEFPLNGEEHQTILLEAPDIPGTYHLVTRASQARGRGEIGRHSVRVDASPPACEGFTGLWQTDFGILRLVIRDGDARGTYRRDQEARPGFLTGTVEGRVLTGAWRSELGNGGTRLTLSADGRSFKGYWGNGPGELGGSGRWEGRCLLEVKGN